MINTLLCLHMLLVFINALYVACENQRLVFHEAHTRDVMFDHI